MTHNPPENRALGGWLSPDGKQLAYVDRKGLHLVVVDTGNLHDIALPAELQTEAWDVQWFPDGENLLLTTLSDTEGHVTWVKSIFSGPPRKLRTGCTAAAVSPDGSTVAFVNGRRREIWVVGANGENARKVFTSEDAPIGTVAWSPTGRRLAYTKVRMAASGQIGATIETVSLAGEAPSFVLSDPRLWVNDGANLLWRSDGRLIFVSELSPGPVQSSNIFSLKVDPRSGRPSGGPAKLTNWYGILATVQGMSRDGTRVAVWKDHLRNDVYVAALTGKGTHLAVPRRFTVSDSMDIANAWTHDSKAILFQSNRTGKIQIFRQPLDQDTAEPLFQASEDQQGAVLSPDGGWILYWASASGGASPPATRRLMRYPTSGGSAAQILEAPVQQDPTFTCSSRPIGSCAYSSREHGNLIIKQLDPLHGLGKELARCPDPGFSAWDLSPDGTRLAFWTPKALRVLDMRNGAQQDLHIQGAGFSGVIWAADGNALFGTGGYTIVRAELDGTSQVILDRALNNWITAIAPSPDGRYLAFSQQTFDSNYWLLQNF